MPFFCGSKLTCEKCTEKTQKWKRSLNLLRGSLEEIAQLAFLNCKIRCWKLTLMVPILQDKVVQVKHNVLDWQKRRLNKNFHKWMSCSKLQIRRYFRWTRNSRNSKLPINRNLYFIQNTMSETFRHFEISCGLSQRNIFQRSLRCNPNLILVFQKSTRCTCRAQNSKRFDLALKSIITWGNITVICVCVNNFDACVLCCCFWIIKFLKPKLTWILPSALSQKTILTLHLHKDCY